jgi:hypothetical protein
MNGSTLPAGLRIGSLLTLITGLFVFTVGTYLFVMFFAGLANPSAPWRSGGFACQSPYSLDNVATCSARWPPGPGTCTSSLVDDYPFSQHVEYANLMTTGAVIAMISIFGLRRRQRWAWLMLLAIFLWVGLNDALAHYRARRPMVPLIPVTIGVTGLFLARKSIFDGFTCPER